MSLPRLLLRIWPWIALALLLLCLVIFWNSIAARFPWSEHSRRVAAEASAAHAQLDASARGLEVSGERESAQRVDTYSHVLIETQAIASEATAEARSAPDASTPLDPDRAARLRGVIDSLCERSPRTCPASPAGNASGSDPAV